MPGTHPRTRTTDQFIAEARERHGEKFDYSQVWYVNAKTHVHIGCPLHGRFDQTPEVHLKGSGCPGCRYLRMAQTRTRPWREILAKFRRRHGDRYDYSQVEYVSLSRKITIACPEHGPFAQRPYCHLKGHGCPRCKCEALATDQRLTRDGILDRFQRVHGDRYDYRHVTPVRNVGSKVLIVCRSHGPFCQSVQDHARGRGCPVCRESRGERRVAQALEELGVPFVRQQRFSTCRDSKPLPFDFFIPSEQLLIEFDGAQHVIPSKRFNLPVIRKHDAIKTDWARRRGLSLIRIPHTDYDQIPKILGTTFTAS